MSSTWPAAGGSTPASPRDLGDVVLSVEGMGVRTRHTPLLVDVGFTVGRGERVGLIGESGSGKSLTALAVLGLLGEDLQARGQVHLAGQDGNLLDLPERRLARLRGSEMAMVFQEPMTALNPTMRVGVQVAEVLRVHGTAAKQAARRRAVELLEQVGLPDPQHVARAYPHQLSGGQRQRVVVAIALANDPVLLVCDEPTTALDVTVQALVLDLIVSGVQARDAALLFITHDLAVVATVCERVLVMYGGRIVEAGPVGEVFTDPRHHYTSGLLAASDLVAADAAHSHPAGADDASSRESSGRRRLPTIAGTVPPAGQFPDGCVFRNRCPAATDVCAQLPPWAARRDHAAGATAYGYACHHPVGVDE